MRAASEDGLGVIERGCGTLVAETEADANWQATRVVLLHLHDDPLEDANLRVYCDACAREHEAATSLAHDG